VPGEIPTNAPPPSPKSNDRPHVAAIYIVSVTLSQP
jgi:hypothetical protein